MATLNKVMLIGNLTRDPELRYTPSGTGVCNFSLAINSFFTGKDGQKKEETTFIKVVVWGKAGENCAQYLTKGRPAFVEGRLQSRSWEGQDGQKRNTIEVVADNVQFLGAKGAGGPRDEEGGGMGGGMGGRSSGSSRPAPREEYEEAPPDDDIPF